MLNVKVGQKVYFRQIMYGGREVERIIECEVTKIGRIYTYAKELEMKWPNVYRFVNANGHCSSAHNSGGTFYASMEALEESRKCEALWDKIRKQIQYWWHAPDHVSLRDMETVAGILGNDQS